jgi:hypothetical protein
MRRDGLPSVTDFPPLSDRGNNLLLLLVDYPSTVLPPESETWVPTPLCTPPPEIVQRGFDRGCSVHVPDQRGSVPALDLGEQHDVPNIPVTQRRHLR